MKINPWNYNCINCVDNWLMAGHQRTAKEITVHPLPHRPSQLWYKISENQTVRKIEPIHPNTPLADDKLRFVCISDTHAQIERRNLNIPPGDILIHAGDITNDGNIHHLERFNEYIGILPHRYKVVIAGNHDISLDDEKLRKKSDILDIEKVDEYLRERGVVRPRDLLTNCTYLEDAFVTICGVKIYGSPWVPGYGIWGFNLQRGQPLLNKWKLIPDDTDVLITHGPPLGHGDVLFTGKHAGHGDVLFTGKHAGCAELLSTVQERVKPKYHVFGHIHEGHGVTTDDVTTYVNAAMCTREYKLDNPPIIFDFPLPKGHKKDELISPIVPCPGQES